MHAAAIFILELNKLYFLSSQFVNEGLSYKLIMKKYFQFWCVLSKMEVTWHWSLPVVTNWSINLCLVEGGRGGRKLKRFIAILRTFFCTRKSLLLVNIAGVYHEEPKSRTVVLKITYFFTPQRHLIISLTPFFSLSLDFSKKFLQFQGNASSLRVVVIWGANM